MQSLGNCLFTCLFTVQADLLHIYGTRPRSGPPAYTFSNINTSSPRLRCPCTRPDCPHRKYNTGFRIEPKRKWPYTHCEVLGVFKGIVHSKMKIFWKVAHSQAIQGVDGFVTSSEEIWINFALHHLLTNGSSVVNGCHQNESPNS